MLLNDCQDMALARTWHYYHMMTVRYTNHTCFSFMNIKEDLKNVGNNEQMKHERKELYHEENISYIYKQEFLSCCYAPIM